MGPRLLGGTTQASCRTATTSGHNDDPQGPGSPASPTAPAQAESLAGRPRTPHRLRWFALSCLVLLVGVGASVTGGMAWTNYQRTQSQRGFVDTASSVSSSIGAALRDDLDFESSLGTMMATFPGLTNHQLAPWFAGLGVRTRYPGTIGFVLIEPVTAAELPAFAAAVNADPLVGAPAQTYAVTPSGARPMYCLARLGLVLPSNPVPEGFDECAPRQGGGAALIVRDARKLIDDGRRAVLGYSSLLQLRKGTFHTGLFAVIEPVYRGGSTPNTVTARQASLVGALIGTFSVKGVVNPILVGTSRLHVTVQAGTGGQISAVGQRISAGSDGRWSLEQTTDTSPAFEVTSASPKGPVPSFRDWCSGRSALCSAGWCSCSWSTSCALARWPCGWWRSERASCATKPYTIR